MDRVRSSAPDPHGRIGKRTCIHPVNLSLALMPDKVEGYYGAPQSVYSDHFLKTGPIDGRRRKRLIRSLS